MDGEELECSSSQKAAIAILRQWALWETDPIKRSEYNGIARQLEIDLLQKE
jgi:hypothetical protein